MKLIAAFLVIGPCGALADIVYTAGTQLSQGAVWTDLSPGAPPEASFSVSGGLDPIDGAVQDVIVSRQTPGGLLAGSAGVGYFGVNRDATYMTSEMQSAAEFEVPSGSEMRTRALALITLDFTLTHASPVEMIASVANHDPGSGPLGSTRTTILLTLAGGGPAVLSLDATSYNEAQYFMGLLHLAAGDYSLLLRNEIDFRGTGDLTHDGGYSRLDFYFEPVPAPGIGVSALVAAMMIGVRRRR